MAKFAFIVHALEINDIVKNVRGVARHAIPYIYKFPFLYNRLVMPRMNKMCSKKVADLSGIVSKTGEVLDGIFVGLPYTAEQIKTAMEQDRQKDPEFLEEILDSCSLQMKIAKEEGCNMLGLGAYSSIVTKGGKLIQNDDMIKLTTGNTNTTYGAVLASFIGSEILQTDCMEHPCAVIGGTGSIGELCTLLLAEKIKEVRIVGRKESKLELTKKRIEKYLSEKGINSEIKIYTDPRKAVKNCKIVISATNNVDAIFSSKQDFESFESGCVIADVARPTDIDSKILKYRNDVLVIDSGIDRVPGNPDWGKVDFGFPKGEAYACMAETMMLSLEDVKESWTESLLTSLNERVRRVEFIKKAREKHGFELASLRSFHKPVSKQYIEKIKGNIQR